MREHVVPIAALGEGLSGAKLAADRVPKVSAHVLVEIRLGFEGFLAALTFVLAHITMPIAHVLLHL